MGDLLGLRRPPQIGEAVVGWVVVDVIDGVLPWQTGEAEGGGD